MATLTRTQASTIRSILDSVQIDLQAVRLGKMTTAELTATTAERFAALSKAFDLDGQRAAWEKPVRLTRGQKANLRSLLQNVQIDVQGVAVGAYTADVAAADVAARVAAFAKAMGF